MLFGFLDGKDKENTSDKIHIFAFTNAITGQFYVIIRLTRYITASE
jgi:hypothetical protein